MAHNIYVQLSANGTAISGDVSINQMGGIDVSADHIEAYGFYHELTTATSTDLRSGGLSYGPITFIKRSDRATPLLMRAWANGHQVNAALKFFAVNYEGETYLQHVYQVEQARIVAVRTEMLNNQVAENAAMPVLERVTLAYPSVQVIHAPSSTEWAGTAMLKR